MPHFLPLPRILIVDGGVADLQRSTGRARAIAAELELAVRQEEDRHRGQLARLVEASLSITSAPSLERVAETTVDAIGQIFGAGGRVVLEHRDRRVRAGPDVPFAGDALGLVSPAQGDRVGGTLEVHRPSQALDPSERLVAAHLHLVTLASAERILFLAIATEKARERQEIVAIVSHDLRTPLQTFAMGLDAIERTISAHEKSALEATVARMKRSIGSMTRLLEDLLDVSRIHDGALPLRIQERPIGPFLEELCAQHQPLAQKRGLALTTEVEPGLRLSCDAERLTQALGNLLGNALRHTADGSIALRARALGEDRVRIEVADSGPGVPREVRGRLFERLYQGETAGRGGGLGLGLYIVQGIAEAHGGVAGVDDHAGPGSTFWLELPREVLPAATSRV